MFFFSRVLTELRLDENNIGDEGAAAIAEALRGNEVLTTLNLANNPDPRPGRRCDRGSARSRQRGADQARALE